MPKPIRHIARHIRQINLIEHMRPCPPQPELVKMYFLYRKEGMQPNDAWAHAMDFLDYPYDPITWPHGWGVACH